MSSDAKNKFLIQDEYNIDLLLVERKIDYHKFAESRKQGDIEKWDEISYVSQHPFFLHSFLMSLKVEHKLRVIKELNKLSFKDIKYLSFGGSIHGFFNYDPEQSGDREYTTQRARLAITLDIPIVFLLMDHPSMDERKSYEFLEYRELGEKVTFKELSSKIKRPEQRVITPFKLEIVSVEDILCDFLGENVFCRLDLHKTFYVMELHPRSGLDVDLNTIRKIMEILDQKVTSVVSYVPHLRDSLKLCLIGPYIEEQMRDANMYSDELIKTMNGMQLFPIDFNLNLIVPY
jgi:hypothetical protein